MTSQHPLLKIALNGDGLKHHDKLMTSRRIYDDHKSGKILDETPAETLTMMKKSFISIVVNLFSIISVTVLASCFFIYF